MTDDDLDDLFAAARADAARPSDGLMARVLADADALQPQRRAPARPRFRLSALIAALGGMGAMAGLATATVAGLWIGLAPPAAVDDLAAAFWVAGDSLDLIPDLEGMMGDADG
ncbi:MAG: dihydroorotate dehydrogenase [Gemmobacter sp.]